jgi:hypothetical protein
MKVLGPVIVLEALAVVLGIGVAIGRTKFTFITPDEFARLLVAFSGYAWPLLAAAGFVIFRKGISDILDAIAYKILTMLSGTLQRGNTRFTGKWAAKSDATVRQKIAVERARRAKLREVQSNPRER